MLKSLPHLSVSVLSRQQYFYEYSFDEIKSRPRHVCPYAVVSFRYKGKEGTPPPKPTAPIRCFLCLFVCF